jgi:hypothetical protein
MNLWVIVPMMPPFDAAFRYAGYKNEAGASQ